MREPYRLQPSELEILRLGREDPNVITDYFFRPYGGEAGFRFDENFTEKGKWQKAVHHAKQTDIIIVGGFGTGKTVGAGMSAAVWAMSTPDFKFLNVCQKAWQAKQMYDFIIAASQGTPFEKLIWEKPRRPFHKITLRFYVGDVLITSTLEFMSADKNATGILSWEGDWINVDEAGLLDNLEEIVTALGSRLRGSIRGRARLGRLSMTTNSWDNYYMWQYFDQAVADPENYLSMVISTRDNKNVTQKQLDKMLARIPENERERWIDGTRPEGKGKFFPKPAVFACEDQLWGDMIKASVDEKHVGYDLEQLYGIGVVHYQLPPRKDELYVIMADPGIDNAPKRNSPVIMVWGIPLSFPAMPARLVAFWWGNGNGAISPFVDRLLYLKGLYKPVMCGVDATGPQKNMAELINVQYLGIDYDEFTGVKILPMDFSGSKKSWYLHALRLFIEAGKMIWPKFVTGIRSQLTNYDPIRDGKIPQDIVATMSMCAFAIRGYFYVDPSDFHNPSDGATSRGNIASVAREARLPAGGRSKRSGR